MIENKQKRILYTDDVAGISQKAIISLGKLDAVFAEAGLVHDGAIYKI